MNDEIQKLINDITKVQKQTQLKLDLLGEMVEELVAVVKGEVVTAVDWEDFHARYL